MGYVFEVDTAEGGLEQLDCADDLVRIFGVEHYWESVHSPQILVQQGLPFHDRESGLGTDVSQSQNAGPVGDDRYKIALVGVVVNLVDVLVDFLAGGRHSGGIPDGEVIEIPDPAFWKDLDLSAIKGMKA